MITICIPVYNFNISRLIVELSRQILALNLPCEIIAIDDCSSFFKEENKAICKNHTYIELPENIGRSRIRNLFLDYASHEYLLFLDCDSLVASQSFLSKYIEEIKQSASVVCGGRDYSTQAPSREKRLRWKYGFFKESQPYEVRCKYPNRSFMTNNFLVHKKILEQNKFDERIAKYGHEDTLFGLLLKEKRIVVKHIDNPVINGDLDTNKEYLSKSNESVKNLVKILNFTSFKNDIIEDVALLRFHNKVKKIDTIINGLFILLKPLIYYLLAHGVANLKLFDFYKLGLLIQYKKSSPQKEF